MVQAPTFIVRERGFESRPPSLMLIRIDAYYFCAGVVVEDGFVVRAAPILKYMMGWSEGRVRSYVARKRWHLAAVS